MSTKTKTRPKQAVQADLELNLEVEKPKDSTEQNDQDQKAERKPFRQKGGIYYYSAGIIGKKNIFVTPEYMDLLVNAFKLAELQQDIKNLAYVVMPNHFMWVFRLSENQDNPVEIYRKVKMNVASEILNTLRDEAKDDAAQLELLDIFVDNEKVSRSNPRRILWSFKEAAKEFEKNKRYRVWDKTSKTFLIDNEKSLIRNIKFITEAPMRDRWQLVTSAFDYPYLYVAEELVDQVTA
jgi:hypothetical protein